MEPSLSISPQSSGGPPPGGWRNPTPTVDVIVETAAGIVLIRRANPPHGLALPGGFIDEGEPAEAAARREALEETGLDVELLELLSVYSDPARDPRKHTLSVVYTARASGSPAAADDAEAVLTVPLAEIEAALTAGDHLRGEAFAFDHAQILRDFVTLRATGQRPRPRVDRQG